MPRNDRIQEILDELIRAMETEAMSDPSISKEELDKLIRLAERITQIDFSSESELKERLREELLNKEFDCELKDDELDYAAGGLMSEWEEKNGKGE